MCATDRVQIDGKANVICDENKLDHSTALQEIGSITDGQAVGVPEDGEVFADAIVLSGAEEYDSTRFRGGDVLKLVDSYWEVVYSGVRSDALQRRFQGIATDYADVERGARR
jgi:hypothetical protein